MKTYKIISLLLIFSLAWHSLPIWGQTIQYDLVPDTAVLRPVAAGEKKRNVKNNGLTPRLTRRTKRHIYYQVKNREAEEILNELRCGGHLKACEYMSRFIKGVEDSKSAHALPFKDPFMILRDDYYNKLNFKRVFHYGLIRDEAGILWIIKKREHETMVPLMNDAYDYDLPENEMLGYLLSKGKANVAEIRFLREKEVRGLKFFKNKKTNCPTIILSVL